MTVHNLSQLLILYGTFMVISLSGALSPGPLSAMAISEGARVDRWAGTRLAFGHGLVEIPLVFGIAYGLGAWLKLPLVSGVIGLVGGAFLVWMGYGLATGAWRGRLRLKQAQAGRAPGVMRLGQIPGGIALTLTNPYWAVWWASVGAIYVGRTMGFQSGLAPLGGLAIAHWLTDLAWLGGLSLLVGSGTGLIGERGYKAILLVCGLFLLVFGIYVCWNGFGFLILGRV
jgi:threonine/homoserine/homoserine lactone efflux protein